MVAVALLVGASLFPCTLYLAPEALSVGRASEQEPIDKSQGLIARVEQLETRAKDNEKALTDLKTAYGRLIPPVGVDCRLAP